MQPIDTWDAIIRLVFAMLCGALVGWERERREKAAGLRTHMFVSMGSALVAIVSSFGFADAVTKNLVVLDPSRIAAQVVSGIGFLGAGVIWFNRNKVRGLDTAAGIWTTSAMGLAAGCAMYIPALTVTAVIFLTNLLLKPIEQRLFPRRKEGRLLITSPVSAASGIDDIRQLIDQAGGKIKGVRIVHDSKQKSVGLEINGPKTLDWFLLVEQIKKLSGITTVSFTEPNLDREDYG